MPKLSDEQIERARSVSMLEYFQTHQPESVKYVNANRHILVEHESFVITNEKWDWYSRDIYGYNALDYLLKVEEMDFVSAVKHLTEGVSYVKSTPSAHEKPKAPSPPKKLTLPKANKNNDLAVAYLMGRGINHATIWKCINEGLLYESANKTCVFVGKDGDTPKYACERSILGNDKKDVFGSDKKHGFSLPPDNPKNTTLMLFEAPLDLLAHYDIMKMANNDLDGHRLSLGGVSSVALKNFLESHPKTSHVYICLDADKAGQDATQRIIRELQGNEKTSHIRITVSPPPIGKDFSDTLQGIRQLQNENQREQLNSRKPLTI
jgi:5S rRNA maturation endonuclease (ribonuclease M5)